MPEAVALHLVVPHLCDELGLHRLLLEVSRAPAVRFREAAVRLLVDQGENLLGDPVVLRCRDRGRAHVVEPAVVPVEPEEQCRDLLRLVLPPDADDHGVGRLVRLHLGDRLPGARPVRVVEPLRDHAVEAGGLEGVEPLGCRFRVERAGGEPEALRELLQLSSALLQGELVQRLALPEENVERDELGRDLLRQPVDSALGRVEPHLHRVEVEDAVPSDHDLAVERGVGREQVAQRAELREVAKQRPLLPRPERELAAVVLEDPAKAVPLGLVLPAVALRQLGDELRLHRRERNVGARHGGQGYPRPPGPRSLQLLRTRAAGEGQSLAPGRHSEGDAARAAAWSRAELRAPRLSWLRATRRDHRDGDREPTRARHALHVERRARRRERDRLHPVVRRQRVPGTRRSRGQRLRAAGCRLSEGGTAARPERPARGRGGEAGRRGRRARLALRAEPCRDRVRIRDRRLPRDHGAARGPAGARTDAGSRRTSCRACSWTRRAASSRSRSG